MNELLLDAFGHSAWATKRLIAACEAVSAEELVRPALGLGSMLATLSHLVVSDARFVATLDGGLPAWLDEAETNELPQLLALAQQSGERWQRLLRQPLDGERLVTLDKGAYETQAGVVVVQALHHVSVHGEQLCASLTALGVAAPDVQPWALADESGRSRWLRPQE
jgi:uncharacterized damage-inducible protein DinB